MKVLIYDTETTGLPDWKKPSDDPSQPHITQICAELCDEDTGETLAQLHTLIKPDGWTIPEELEKLTGITTERATTDGLPIGIVLPFFMELWCRADHRAAHNESFDMRMVRIAILRDPGGSPEDADRWKAGRAFCTMNLSKPIVKLPPSPRMVEKGVTGFKPPNLGEAYQHFTGQPLTGAHNAAVDVMACKAVYFAIKKAA